MNSRVVRTIKLNRPLTDKEKQAIEEYNEGQRMFEAVQSIYLKRLEKKYHKHLG